MPSFNVNFEVFCGTCNAGLCGQSEGRNSHRRDEPQVTVEVCRSCLDAATAPLNDEIASLQARIEELEAEAEAERLAHYL